MKFLRKIIFGVVFLGMISGSCFMTTHADIDLAETRILLEEQLALIDLDVDVSELTEKEQYKLAIEKKNLEKAITHLKELEEHKGIAEYWDNIKTKATKGTIIAAAVGGVAAIAGIILLWKGISAYREMQRERDAERTAREQESARMADQINTLAIQNVQREDRLEMAAAEKQEILDELKAAKEQMSSIPKILEHLKKQKKLKEIDKAESRVEKIEQSLVDAEEKHKKEEEKRLKEEEKKRKKEEAKRLKEEEKKRKAEEKKRKKEEAKRKKEEEKRKKEEEEKKKEEIEVKEEEEIGEEEQIEE